MHTKKCDYGAEKEIFNHVMYRRKLYEKAREYVFEKKKDKLKKVKFNINKITNY